MRWIFPLLAMWLLVPPTAADATPLNSWKISCGVDQGAITRKGKDWTFRTSSNHCDGGIFKQRAEISTGKVSPSHKGAYLFSATIAMTSATAAKWDVFQIHDARDGCAPPLKLTVLRSGRMELTSDIKTGPGESCIRGFLTQSRSHGRIARDGREQKLEVLVEFDGAGGFLATVWLDGEIQLSGQYQAPSIPGAFRSKYFYFKHGCYSQHSFDYELVSRGMKVKKVRVNR